MPFTLFWLPLGFCMMIGWVVTTWIRARHGYPLDDGAGGRVPRTGFRSADMESMEARLAERDAAIRDLEERVRVLERIVTDSSAQVSAEIDRLRG